MLALIPDRSEHEALSVIADALGIRQYTVHDIDETHALFTAHSPGIVLLPAFYQGESTLACVQSCLEAAPETEVIMVVERDQINEAAEAMRAGVLDCLFRPFSQDRLAKTLAAAMRRRGLPVPETDLSFPAIPKEPAAKPAPDTRGTPPAMPEADCITGSHAATMALKAAIAAVAEATLPVLLIGEAGSGKSHCARLIHTIATRGEAPFHKLDCAALTPEDLPAEMVDPASSATFFFDEITDLSAKVQARLVRMIGDDDQLPARLISATSHDPIKATSDGRVRRDLFYRLCVTEIQVPPLRDRGADVLLIAREKLRQATARKGGMLEKFAPEVQERFLAYQWPGNIRQLSNVIRNIVVLHGKGSARTITLNMLPEEISQSRPGSGPVTPMPDHGDFLASQFRGQSLAQIERAIIEAIIRDHGNSVTRAARALQVAPSTLYRKREQWAAQDRAKKPQ